MASVLQVISAIERIANAAVDIARIVTHRLGIPRELVADLSKAEEVSHRVLIREGSHMAHRPLAALELPVATGMRVMAIRRGRDWITDEIDGDQVFLPGDVLFLRGSPAGITRLRELAGGAGLGAGDAARRRRAHRPRPGRRRARRDEEHLRGRRRPGLLGARARATGPGRRGPPPRGPARRDEGPPRAVGAARRLRPTSTRHRCGACCTCPRPPRTSATRPSRWCGSSSSGEEIHPILGIALGETDEVVVRVPVAAGSAADGATLSELQLDIEPGFHVLAIQRDGRYLYRPRRLRPARGRRRAHRQRSRRGPRPPGRALRLAVHPRRGDRRARAPPPRPRQLSSRVRCSRGARRLRRPGGRRWRRRPSAGCTRGSRPSPGWRRTPSGGGRRDGG